MPSRIQGFDKLRGIAVFLVFMNHSDAWLVGHPSAVAFVRSWGWTAIDMFFVLSGFLIAGMLFDERIATGRVRPWRFLARRGMKIYPSFYVFIAASLLFPIGARPPTLTGVLAELLFFQNYPLGLWWHTWSMAVEEHFYLLITLTVAFAPRAVVPALVAALILCPLARTITFLTMPFSIRWSYMTTHLRIDALSYGCLLAWLARYRADVVRELAIRRRRILVAGGVAASLLPMAFDRAHPFMATLGYSVIDLAYAGLVAALAYWPMRGGFLAFIGRRSYPIYLWHLSLLHCLPIPHSARNLPYFVASALVLGVTMSYAVELPFLRLRDRIRIARDFRSAR